MLILATVPLPPNSLASSSSAGAIIRQGPHHSAQKSTTTGFFELRTSAWKEASETLIGEDVPVFAGVSEALTGEDMVVLRVVTIGCESRNGHPQGQGACRSGSVP